MPLVAIRASVRDVLPWSYLILSNLPAPKGDNHLPRVRECKSGDSVSLVMGHTCSFTSATHISNLIRVALQRNKFVRAHSGHSVVVNTPNREMEGIGREENMRR